MKENMIKCENDYCENEALGDDAETGLYFPSCESCLVDWCNW
jgi:hypothetical protein